MSTDAELIAFLERTLAQAREGRVLFLVASAGVVGGDARKPSLAGLDVRELFAGSRAATPEERAVALDPARVEITDESFPLPEARTLAKKAVAALESGPGRLLAEPNLRAAIRAADTAAVTKTYAVEVGAFVGGLADGLGPHELASALRDCISGAHYAEAGLAETIATRVDAALPATEKRS